MACILKSVNGIIFTEGIFTTSPFPLGGPIKVACNTKNAAEMEMAEIPLLLYEHGMSWEELPHYFSGLLKRVVANISLCSWILINTGLDPGKPFCSQTVSFHPTLKHLIFTCKLFCEQIMQMKYPTTDTSIERPFLYHVNIFVHFFHSHFGNLQLNMYTVLLLVRSQIMTFSKMTCMLMILDQSK